MAAFLSIACSYCTGKEKFQTGKEKFQNNSRPGSQQHYRTRITPTVPVVPVKKNSRIIPDPDHSSTSKEKIPTRITAVPVSGGIKIPVEPTAAVPRKSPSRISDPVPVQYGGADVEG